MNETHKKYLVVKGSAGLGNRLITLMSAINYAKVTKRYLFVDWADGMFGEIGENVFFKYFELSNVKYVKDKKEIVDALYNGASRYPKSLTANDLENSIWDNFYTVDTTLLKRFPIYKIAISLIFKHKLGYIFGLQSWQRISQGEKRGYWQAICNMNDNDNFPLGSNLSHWLKQDVVLFSDFRPLCNISKIFEYIHLKDKYYSLFNQFANQNKLNNAIGVHVRATDKMPKQKINNLFNRVNNILMKDPSLNIFLSTDNLTVENEFKSKYGVKILTYSKYLPENLEMGIHRWAEGNADKLLKEKMFEECLADMWLLSMCKYLFWQGNSSFSYISKHLKKDKSTTRNWMGLLR